MQNEDEYNGYVNFETWAAATLLNNTEWLQNEGARLAKRAGSRVELADQLKEFVESLIDDMPTHADVKALADEIGSRWRVDWKEVADSFREDWIDETA